MRKWVVVAAIALVIGLLLVPVRSEVTCVSDGDNPDCSEVLLSTVGLEIPGPLLMFGIAVLFLGSLAALGLVFDRRSNQDRTRSLGEG
jgi:hypothetical protein